MYKMKISKKLKTSFPLRLREMEHLDFIINNFKCPHCGETYIDFLINNSFRAKGYYGNTFINEKPKRYNN